MHICLHWTYICLWAHTCCGTHVEVRGQCLSWLPSRLSRGFLVCLYVRQAKLPLRCRGFVFASPLFGGVGGPQMRILLSGFRVHEFWATNWGLHTYAASTWLTKPPFQPQHDIFIQSYDFPTTFITITFSDYEAIISGQQEFLHTG